MSKKYSKLTGLLKYWKSIVWAVIIAILLFMPGGKMPKQHFFSFEHADKLVHLILFWVFVFFLYYEGRNPKSSSGARTSFVAIATLYAFSTEVIQYLFIRGRSGSWQDLLADITGCLLGILTYRLFICIKGRSSLRN